MPKCNLQALSQPEVEADPLHELIRRGARDLIAGAVEAGVGDVNIQVPKVRDRNKSGVSLACYWFLILEPVKFPGNAIILQ